MQFTIGQCGRILPIDTPAQLSAHLHNRKLKSDCKCSCVQAVAAEPPMQTHFAPTEHGSDFGRQAAAEDQRLAPSANVPGMFGQTEAQQDVLPPLHAFLPKPGHTDRAVAAALNAPPRGYMDLLEGGLDDIVDLPNVANAPRGPLLPQ